MNNIYRSAKIYLISTCRFKHISFILTLQGSQSLIMSHYHKKSWRIYRFVVFWHIFLVYDYREGIYCVCNNIFLIVKIKFRILLLAITRNKLYPFRKLVENIFIFSQLNKNLPCTFSELWHMIVCLFFARKKSSFHNPFNIGIRRIAKCICVTFLSILCASKHIYRFIRMAAVKWTWWILNKYKNLQIQAIQHFYCRIRMCIFYCLT